MNKPIKKKHSIRFFMISIYFPQLIYKMMDENPMAILVLFALMDSSDNDGASIISERNLHQCLKISYSTVSRAVKYLNNNGYIKILKFNGQNLYIINSNLFWHTKSVFRNKLSKDMNFPPALELTQTKNRKYYNRHNELKAFDKNHYGGPLIRKCIAHYYKNLYNKQKISKINSITKRHAKNNIRKYIRRDGRGNKIHWTNKQRTIIHYLLQHIPLDAKSLGLKMTNKELCKPTNSSYATVAKTTLKLKELNIIVHKHGYIKYNPEFLPMTKVVASTSQSSSRPKTT